MTYYVGENVTIHANVVIASGVVLEAVPGSRVIVGEGACIGAGTVVQAYGGDLVLSVGVSLGKDVLLLGRGIVGQKACIGAESTLVDPQVAASQVIPARSLLANGHPHPVSQAMPEGNQPTTANGSTVNGATAEGEDEPRNGHAPTNLESDTVTVIAPTPVYGREQVMRLVHTLFPHRRPLNAESESS